MTKVESKIYDPEWFYRKALELPSGTSRAHFMNKVFIIAKTTFSEGRSLKIFADEVGGNDFISLNIYKTKTGKIYVKPCEQPLTKSQKFFEEAVLF